jgi:UDP-N-acetylmuramoylalanine--D-glutamate ligase
VELVGNILVVGLGATGESASRYLARRMVSGTVSSVTAVDENDTSDLRRRAEALRALGVRTVLGTGSVEGRYDLAVVSPGLAPMRPLMRSAEEHSRQVVSELELAFGESRSPWIAITGTNGKTTTTNLVWHLLVSAGMPAEKVGNIGRPAIDVVEDATASTAIVAEASSFQLAHTRTFRPRVAVLLNVTPDHIDWHGSLEAYTADKARIFANQGPGDVAVVDVDDPGSALYASAVEERGVRVIRVTLAAPPEGGAGLVGDMLALDTPRGVVELVSVAQLKIRGDHNVSNALAGAAAAHAFGAHPDAIRTGLATFEPIEHRLEPVADLGGIEYFNDSKATNPDAVLKALTAFGDRPLIMLLGGRNKNNDFSDLARAVADRAKGAVLFGEAARELARAFEGSPVPHPVVATMQEAFRAAERMAEAGDAILLSPACASFDEFSGYEARGRAFKELVDQSMGRRGGDTTDDSGGRP